MTKQEALREADALIEAMLRSGDEQLFIAAQRPDGTIDTGRLTLAAVRARHRLADHLMNENKQAP